MSIIAPNTQFRYGYQNPGTQQDDFPNGYPDPGGGYTPMPPTDNPNSSGPSGDVWAGINPQLVQIYQSMGIQNPGQRGAGFTDAAYWNDKPDQWQRLRADLAGNGPDEPGPGDVGNTSGRGGGLGSPSGQIPYGGPQDPRQYGNRPYNQYQGITKPGMGRVPNNPSMYYGLANSAMNQAGMNQGQSNGITGFNGQVNNTGTLLGGSSNGPSGMNTGMNQPMMRNSQNMNHGPSPFANNATSMGAPSFGTMNNMNQNSMSQKPSGQNYSVNTGFRY
jgi:hypothetical protein